MRSFITLFFICALATVAPPAFADANDELKGGPVETRMSGHEPDTYRFGYPYSSTRGTTPGLCEQNCNRDNACAAWSLVPATFRMGPRCELKRSIGSSQRRPGAVSGIASKFHPRAQPMRQTASSPPRPVPARTAPRPAAPPVVRASPVRRAPGPAQRPVIYRPGPRSDTSGLKGAPSNSGQIIRTAPTRRPVITTPPPAARPAPAPVLDAVTRPGPPPPSRAAGRFELHPQPAPSPLPPAPVGTQSQPGEVQIFPPPPPIKPRKPWTERGNDEADYSVQDMDYVPGDEQATAGYIDGAPEQ